jgi:hypothetical protein
MATVHHVKKARKDNKAQGIKKGNEYWWWSFKHGYSSSKHYSLTPPKRSQTTQSPFYAAMYDIEDMISDAVADDTLPGVVESIVEALREAADECQEKFDNMPEGLQQGDTGQLLEQRVEACNTAADEFEGIDMEVPEIDLKGPEGSGETEETFWQEKLDEVQGISIDYE